MAAGVAMAEAVAEVAGVDARLKWPNDLVVDVGGGIERKLAGILAEADWPAGSSASGGYAAPAAAASGSPWWWASGVNVNWPAEVPAELADVLDGLQPPHRVVDRTGTCSSTGSSRASGPRTGASLEPAGRPGVAAGRVPGEVGDARATGPRRHSAPTTSRAPRSTSTTTGGSSGRPRRWRTPHDRGGRRRAPAPPRRVKHVAMALDRRDGWTPPGATVGPRPTRRRGRATGRWGGPMYLFTRAGQFRPDSIRDAARVRGGGHREGPPGDRPRRPRLGVDDVAGDSAPAPGRRGRRVARGARGGQRQARRLRAATSSSSRRAARSVAGPLVDGLANRRARRASTRRRPLPAYVARGPRRRRQRPRARRDPAGVEIAEAADRDHRGPDDVPGRHHRSVRRLPVGQPATPTSARSRPSEAALDGRRPRGWRSSTGSGSATSRGRTQSIFRRIT